MHDWIKAALSSEQLEPFTREHSNASILAAAGSGKTRTLVHLLLEDLASGVPASSIVAFTFTEKAGEELMARIHALARKHLPDTSLNGLYIGTIHGWCLDYLLEQSDFYNFAALDELHTDALASRLHDSIGLSDVYGLPFPRGVQRFLKDLELFYNEHIPESEVPSEIRPAIARFVEILQANRLLTYGAMIRNAADHLSEAGPISGLSRLYVDEYQDVNPAQVRLLHLMVTERGRTTVVGDDLQCIYQWRGSDVQRILEFPGEFPPASVHRLSENYRARPPLVELANAIAERVSLRDPHKVMRPVRDPVKSRVIHWCSLQSEADQAEVVAEVVQRFVSGGTPPSGIAVLLRSVRGAGQPIVDALEDRGIPVYCPALSRGGQFIEDLLLPICDWLRVEHREPKNEIEEQEVEERADALWATVEPWVTIENGFQVFWGAMSRWLDAIERQTSGSYNIRAQLYDLFDAVGVRVGSGDPNLLAGLAIASQIIRSIEEIHRRRLHEQPRRTPRGVMAEVYFALRRHLNDFGETDPVDVPSDGVRVTTVHKAKGLEWPLVLLPMLMDQRFPVRARSHGTSFPDALASRYGTSIDDERRLFYVAVTRARERLFLFDPTNEMTLRSSTFLNELKDAGLVANADLASVDSEMWTIASDDLAESDPPPIRIGLSDLLIYLECPYQYGLRRVASIQPSVGDDLGFGLGLHELVQRRLDGDEPWGADEWVKQAATHVYLPYTSAQSQSESQRVIAERLAKIDELDLFAADAECEVDVEVLLSGGVVHGTVDVIERKDDGSVAIRDWKSSIHSGFLPRYQRQLQFYTHALREQDHNVTKADIIDVAATAERGEIVSVDVSIVEADIDNLVSMLESALKAIAEADFRATPGIAVCTTCDMRRVCGERWADE